jgi:hypothetical protein
MDNVILNVLTSSRKEKETWMLCLFCNCPYSQTNPTDCQLHDIRKQMTIFHYKNFINSKSDLEIDELLVRHFNCPNNKY